MELRKLRGCDSDLASIFGSTAMPVIIALFCQAFNVQAASSVVSNSSVVSSTGAGVGLFGGFPLPNTQHSPSQSTLLSTGSSDACAYVEPTDLPWGFGPNGLTPLGSHGTISSASLGASPEPLSDLGLASSQVVAASLFASTSTPDIISPSLVASNVSMNTLPVSSISDSGAATAISTTGSMSGTISGSPTSATSGVCFPSHRL